MTLPQLRFTLRQLIAAVALCAVLFALLRTPIWPLVIAIVPVLPGIAIDRARGGRGVVGGTVAGGIAAIGFTFLFARVADYGPLQPVDPASLFFSALFALPFGLLFGAIMSGWVRDVLWLLQRGRSTLEAKSDASSPPVGVVHPSNQAPRPMSPT